LAFGSIAGSVLGGGWIDAAGRGAALGLLLAQAHRYNARNGATFWSFIFYVWATVSAYHSLRAATFGPVGYLFYRFLPVAITVKVLASVPRAMPRTRVTGTQVRLERSG
jgi:hypothetical protein